MVFITGATGFIGGYISRELCRMGFDLRCLARRASDTSRIPKQGAQVVIGDIGDRDFLKEAMNGCDVAIHAAAAITATTNSGYLSKVNTAGTANMVDAAVESGVKKFIFISSMDVLFDPESEYARSKFEAERIVGTSSLRSFFIIRPSLVYGKEDTKNISLLVRLVKKTPIIPITGNGMFRWQPLYIEDLVECVADVVSDTQRESSFINIAGPSRITFNELIDTICEELGVKRGRVFVPSIILKVLEKLFGFVGPGKTIGRILASSRDKIVEEGTDISLEEGRTDFRLGMKKMLGKG